MKNDETYAKKYLLDAIKSPNRDDFHQNLSLVVKKDIFEILTKLFEIDFNKALL